MPGWPRTVTRCGRSRAARVRASQRRSSSSVSRPTIGRSSRRRCRGASRIDAAPAARQSAGHACPWPLIGESSSPRTACPTSAQVASPTRPRPVPPPAPAGQQRSPRRRPPATRPASRRVRSTSPVLTPMRAWISPIARPHRASQRPPAPPVTRRPRARWGSRTPPPARRRSPSRPCRHAARRALGRPHRTATSRPASASGSRRSPSSVEPTTSQNTTVTVLRTSRERLVAASGAPQELQKRAPSGFSWPHCPHSITISSLRGRRRCRFVL